MAHIYDQIDLTWSWNGDYSLEGGDLSDTSSDYLISLKQDVHTIVASELGDWESLPGLGAGLSDYIGEPNIRSTAEAIHDRIKIALISTGIVAPEDLLVKVFPVHIHKVMILIKVNALPTPWNSLADGETVTVQLVFDFMEQGITFFEQIPSLITS